LNIQATDEAQRVQMKKRGIFFQMAQWNVWKVDGNKCVGLEELVVTRKEFIPDPTINNFSLGDQWLCV
jgi:hypothetical protein